MMSGNSYPNGIAVFDLANNAACVAAEKKDGSIDIDYEDVELKIKPGKKRSGIRRLLRAMLHVHNYLIDKDRDGMIKMFWVLWLAVPGVITLLAFIFLPHFFGIDRLGRLIGGAVYFLGAFSAFSAVFLIEGNMRKFHGAEHKVIICQRDKKPLTVENIKAQPRRDKNCGTGIFAYIWLLYLIAYICVPFVDPLIRLGVAAALLPVSAFISTNIFSWAAAKKSPLRSIVIAPSILMQTITTAEPQEKHIEIGLFAMNRLLMKRMKFISIESGFFTGNLFTGKAELTTKSSHYYKGYLINNERTGQGIYRLPDGSEYNGGFFDNKFHGKGRMTYSNKDYYEGQWTRNIETRGIYHCATGEQISVYLGKFYYDYDHESDWSEQDIPYIIEQYLQKTNINYN